MALSEVLSKERSVYYQVGTLSLMALSEVLSKERLSPPSLNNNNK